MKCYLIPKPSIHRLIFVAKSKTTHEIACMVKQKNIPLYGEKLRDSARNLSIFACNIIMAVVEQTVIHVL